MKKATYLDKKVTSGAHSTYWIDSLDKPLEFEKIDRDYETDVVIIGGGMAGVTTAYILSKSGKKVMLVEDGLIASGETGRSSAQLCSALDDGFAELHRIHGEEGLKLICESHKAAIDFIESTVEDEKINCDFKRVPGYIFIHPNDSTTNLTEELIFAQKAGLSAKILNRVPGFKTDEGECIEFDNQAQFHPLKYLSALCKLIIQNKGRIFTSTHAKEITTDGITTEEGFKIKAKHVVIATNTPVNDTFTIHLKQYPFRTYIIGSLIKKGTVPSALWWDTGDQKINPILPPYHYIRVVKYNDEFDLLITGGEDHPTALADYEENSEEARFEVLEKWAKKRFDIEKVIYRWSGQILEPMDSIGFIGRNPFDFDNVYICTGDSGNGLTNATIAGILISDLINGKANKWEELYNPSRLKLLKSGGAFLKENLGNITHYLKELPYQSDLTSLKSLKDEEGMVIRMNGEFVAMYKDAKGTIHKISAHCTHLGCIIKWNNAEKSWDCPCHGSRFNAVGQVINGPANHDLSNEIWHPE